MVNIIALACFVCAAICAFVAAAYDSPKLSVVAIGLIALGSVFANIVVV